MKGAPVTRTKSPTTLAAQVVGNPIEQLYRVIDSNHTAFDQLLLSLQPDRTFDEVAVEEVISAALPAELKKAFFDYGEWHSRVANSHLEAGFLLARAMQGNGGAK